MNVWNEDCAVAQAKWRFGVRVYKARKRSGLTIIEAAARAGISTAVAERIETGQVDPGLRLMVDLAHAVNVPLKELVDGLETPTPIDARMIKVMAAMLAAFPNGRWHGSTLADHVELSPGALYPTLARLEEAGFVENHCDDVEGCGVRGPGQNDMEVKRARLYRLTALGAELTRRVSSGYQRNPTKGRGGPDI